MRIRYITFDHHGHVDHEKLLDITQSCNVQITFMGLSLPVVNFIAQYVYSIELMEDSDVNLLAEKLEALNQ